MSSYKERVASQVVELRTGIPTKLNELDSVIASRFPHASLSEASNELRKLSLSNTIVAEILAITREQQSQLIADLGKIAAWIALRIPTIEDGGNFGVAIQHEIRKVVVEAREKIKKDFDVLPDYFSARAAAVEKVAPRSSVENKEVSSKSNVTGGKDGPEDKTSTTQSTERSTKTTEALYDQVEHVVAIDTKWYFALHNNLEDVRSTYAVIHDLVDKNFDKLDHPKGKSRARTRTRTKQ